MVSGAERRKRKKQLKQGQQGQGQASQQRTTTDEEDTHPTGVDAEEEEEEAAEALALARALGDGLQQQQLDDAAGGVTAALARRLATQGISLVVTPDKGRVCVAAGGFEPGRVLLEERAYVHGSGACAFIMMYLFVCVGRIGGSIPFEFDSDPMRPWCATEPPNQQQPQPHAPTPTHTQAPPPPASSATTAPSPPTTPAPPAPPSLNCTRPQWSARCRRWRRGWPGNWGGCRRWTGRARGSRWV